jgi:branched-chain amino acid transport system substrate-binding protein
LVFTGSFFDPVYWDGCKGGVMGAYGWLAGDLQAPSPPVKAFLDAYQKKYDAQATVYCIYGADAVSTLIAGLQKAGKIDRVALQQAMIALDITTPLGTRVHFKNPPDGENLDPTVVCAQVTGRGTYAVI